MSRVLGVIPARFSSTRLPGKPLADILGKPMVEWVYRSAKKALSNVVVATDDKRVFDAVRTFGGKAVMTSKSCPSGTDRMKEVAKKINARYYVNIQGDEPMMSPTTIRQTVALALKKKAIATAATPLKEHEKIMPSAVKVVVGRDGRAIYFSRALIPFTAHGVQARQAAPLLKHLGLYVYPRQTLFQYAALKPTALEQTEKLEQLRALYNGLPIYVCVTPYDSIGVDTPHDLRVVTKKLRRTL